MAMVGKEFSCQFNSKLFNLLKVIDQIDILLNNIIFPLLKKGYD